MTDEAAGAAAPVGHQPKNPDFAMARTALILVVFLQLALAQDVQAGADTFSKWLIPVGEVMLLLALSSLTTIHTRRLAAGLDPIHVYIERHGGAPRILAITLISAITLTNIVSLFRLVEALLTESKASGLSLLDDAANLWITNVVCFALWYWELDRGGPAVRGLPGARKPDFLFTNMQMPEYCEKDWGPGFIDYLFLSFTNATAFSPTDCLPLTQQAKVVMMMQASVSLLTIALVAARAVNILG